MLLPDPPQLHGTLNRLEHYRVAERLGVIAASADEHASQAKSLLQVLLDETEFETAIYASLFDRSFADAKGLRARRSEVGARGHQKRITVTARMTSPGDLSVRIVPHRYFGRGKWGWAREWRQNSFSREPHGYRGRPADELLFLRGCTALTKDLSGGFRLRGRNDDLDEIRRLHAQVIVLRFWKAVLRLAFHFDVAVESYPAIAADGPPRAPALDVIDAVDAHRQHTKALFEAFETTTGHPPDRVWEICASHRSQRDHFHLDEAARTLNRTGRIRLTPAQIERAFGLLRTAVDLDIYAPPASISDYAPLIKRAQVQSQRPFKMSVVQPPKGPAPSGELSYAGMRTFPIEQPLADELGVTSTEQLVAKLNEIWRSRGERLLPQGSYPVNKTLLARVVKLYRSELKAVDVPSAQIPTSRSS